MFSFTFLNEAEFPQYARELFRILEGNMSVIAPTGLSFEENYQIWLPNMLKTLPDSDRRLILIRDLDTGELAGYFMYSLKKDVWYMEDIQFLPKYQKKYGIFRKLYGFVLAQFSTEPVFVEANAHRNNTVSNAILSKLGLVCVGTNRSGNSWHYRGSYADLLKWYRRSA